MSKEEQKREEIKEEDFEESKDDAIEEAEGELSEEELAEQARQAKREKRNNVLIFVFLAVMGVLIIGAIAVVVYFCGGSASGCNCGQC